MPCFGAAPFAMANPESPCKSRYATSRTPSFQRWRILLLLTAASSSTAAAATAAAAAATGLQAPSPPLAAATDPPPCSTGNYSSLIAAAYGQVAATLAATATCATPSRRWDNSSSPVLTTHERLVLLLALSRTDPGAAASGFAAVFTASQWGNGMLPSSYVSAVCAASGVVFPPQDVWGFNASVAKLAGRGEWVTSTVPAPPLAGSVALTIFYAWWTNITAAASSAARPAEEGTQQDVMTWLASVWHPLFAWHQWLQRGRVVSGGPPGRGSLLLLTSPFESVAPASLSWERAAAAAVAAAAGGDSANAFTPGTRPPDPPPSLTSSAAWVGPAAYEAGWAAAQCAGALCGGDAACAVSAGCPLLLTSAIDNAVLWRSTADLLTLAAWLRQAASDSSFSGISAPDSAAVSALGRWGPPLLDGTTGTLFVSGGEGEGRGRASTIVEQPAPPVVMPPMLTDARKGTFRSSLSLALSAIDDEPHGTDEGSPVLFGERGGGALHVHQHSHTSPRPPHAPSTSAGGWFFDAMWLPLSRCRQDEDAPSNHTTLPAQRLLFRGGSRDSSDGGGEGLTAIVGCWALLNSTYVGHAAGVLLMAAGDSAASAYGGQRAVVDVDGVPPPPPPLVRSAPAGWETAVVDTLLSSPFFEPPPLVPSLARSDVRFSPEGTGATGAMMLSTNLLVIDGLRAVAPVVTTVQAAPVAAAIASSTSSFASSAGAEGGGPLPNGTGDPVLVNVVLDGTLAAICGGSLASPTTTTLRAATGPSMGAAGNITFHAAFSSRAGGAAPPLPNSTPAFMGCELAPAWALLALLPPPSPLPVPVPFRGSTALVAMLVVVLVTVLASATACVVLGARAIAGLRAAGAAEGQQRAGNSGEGLMWAPLMSGDEGVEGGASSGGGFIVTAGFGGSQADYNPVTGGSSMSAATAATTAASGGGAYAGARPRTQPWGLA